MGMFVHNDEERSQNDDSMFAHYEPENNNDNSMFMHGKDKVKEKKHSSQII
jgi:hypothetical protein